MVAKTYEQRKGGRQGRENKDRQGTEVTNKGLLRRLRQWGNVRAVVKGSGKPTTDTTANVYFELGRFN